VREDGRLVGGKEWKERIHNRDEWKKLLRTARNRCILHIPIEGTNCDMFQMICPPSNNTQYIQNTWEDKEQHKDP
jgi:hypothetical protein